MHTFTMGEKHSGDKRLTKPALASSLGRRRALNALNVTGATFIVSQIKKEDWPSSEECQIGNGRDNEDED